jgi:hypothetical protein
MRYQPTMASEAAWRHFMDPINQFLHQLSTEILVGVYITLTAG